MPRISRNTVTFAVEGTHYAAIFAHQHCEESRDPDDLTTVTEVFEDENGDEVSEERDVRRVIKPIQVCVMAMVEGREQKIVQRLRHITTCRLYKGSTLLGRGVAKCSVKDNYNWRRGIKDSLKRAIADACITQLEGKLLHSFYTELPHRVEPPVEDLMRDTVPAIS